MFGRSLPELGDGGDLLAEVERAAPGQLGLVGPIDPGELLEPDDLEGRAVADVGRGEAIDLGPLRRVVLPGRLDRAGPEHRPPGLSIGQLVRGRAAIGVEVVAAALGSLELAQPGVLLADLRWAGCRLPCCSSRAKAAANGAVTLLEDRLLLGDVGVEISRA